VETHPNQTMTFHDSDSSPPAGRTAHPSVSVVMPTLNQADTLARSVASVFSQDIEGLELIVQDGGSSDETLALLDALGAQHPGLSWISEPDGGPAQALNRAFSRARGAFVGWLNSDDLYTPGAARRAIDLLRQQPEWLMVYGEAQHIDANGTVIGRYPSLGPDAPLAAWADGCPVCQPSVWLRRETIAALGPLDESLRTAFDFEYWLRLMSRFPGRAGFVTEVQAQSRLHPGAITLRMRETVAMEGLEVVHRHLGSAPPHWLLTHADEVLREPPTGDGEPPLLRLRRLAQLAEPWLSSAGFDELLRRLNDHRGLQLSTAHLGAPVHGDGWAPALMELPWVQPDPSARLLRLHGHHRGIGAMRIDVEGAGAPVPAIKLSAPESFTLDIPLAGTPGTRGTVTLRCSPPFVPARMEPGSDDQRELGFVLEALELRSE
jgi:hypothetical protein